MSIEELCTACRNGDIPTIKRILTLGGLDVNSCSGGVTPLMEAMGRNHPAMVTPLLAHPEIRLNCTSSDGLGPLHFACYGNTPFVIPVFGKDRRCTPAGGKQLRCKPQTVDTWTVSGRWPSQKGLTGVHRMKNQTKYQKRKLCHGFGISTSQELTYEIITYGLNLKSRLQLFCKHKWLDYLQPKQFFYCKFSIFLMVILYTK